MENARCETVICASHVKKGFGEQSVLRDVSLNVQKGDVVAILGPSGSGKTTFLRCLNFLERADGGTLRFAGEDFNLRTIRKRDIARIRMRTAFVFQSYNLFLNKTALDNVTEGLIVARKMPRQKAVETGRQMLDRVGLADRAGAYPAELSGGQQQRVAIARALVKMPRILLLDEPLSNLDARLRLQTREEIRRIQKATGITTVFVTHDQEEAMSISDLIVVMKDGIFMQMGRPQEVYDDPASLFVAKFLGNPPINVFKGEVQKETLWLGDQPVLSVRGVPDQPVTVGIRPEGFILTENGPFAASLSRVEVMGRDVSVISAHPCSENPSVRSIITAETPVDRDAGSVHFSLKPSKVFLFHRETGARIPFSIS